MCDKTQQNKWNKWDHLEDDYECSYIELWICDLSLSLVLNNLERERESIWNYEKYWGFGSKIYLEILHFWTIADGCCWKSLHFWTIADLSLFKIFLKVCIGKGVEACGDGRVHLQYSMTTKHVWEHKSGEWIVEVLTKHFAQMHLSDPFQTWWRTHGSRSEETGQNTRGRILRRRAARDIDYAAAPAAARLFLLIDGITRRSDQQKGAAIRCNLCTGGNCSTLCRRTTLGRIFLLSQHSGSLSSLLSVFALIAFHQLPVVARDQCSGTKGGAFAEFSHGKEKKTSILLKLKTNSTAFLCLFSAVMLKLRFHFKCFLQWCSNWDSWVFCSDDADNLGF